jgi:ribonuclease Y
LANKEQTLDKSLQQAKDRQNELTNRERKLTEKEEIVAKEKKEAEVLLKGQRAKLEEMAGLTTHDAKAELMRQMEYDARKEATRIIKKIEENARDRAKSLARIITTQAVEKIVPYLPLEGAVSVVRLPTEEMKGRVIGREGRNIRAFERVTGVDVIVDDTPEIIMLASHNPLRREIAKLTLEHLVEDGRIHPARIEEFFEKARETVDESILTQGRDALFHLGIPNMHEHLVNQVGRMRLRMSHGQNLLEHSMEVAKIALYMAQAVGANAETVKRAGILHETPRGAHRRRTRCCWRPTYCDSANLPPWWPAWPICIPTTPPRCPRRTSSKPPRTWPSRRRGSTRRVWRSTSSTWSLWSRWCGASRACSGSTP